LPFPRRQMHPRPRLEFASAARGDPFLNGERFSLGLPMPLRALGNYNWQISRSEKPTRLRDASARKGIRRRTRRARSASELTSSPRT
jgi:hypothetical protein